MDSRARIRTLIAGEPADRVGFWLGNPHPDTWPIYMKHFGVASEEALRRELGDDFRWVCPQFFPSTYQHPQGKAMFDFGLTKERHGQAGPFELVEDPAEVDAYEWPSTGHLHLEESLEALRQAGPYYRAGGFWTCFYHNVMDLFGMEAYLTKMYTHPLSLIHI